MAHADTGSEIAAAAEIAPETDTMSATARTVLRKVMEDKSIGEAQKANIANVLRYGQDPRLLRDCGRMAATLRRYGWNEMTCLSGRAVQEAIAAREYMAAHPTNARETIGELPKGPPGPLYNY